jgi:uncharacterized protein (TIGR02448 family)
MAIPRKFHSGGLSVALMVFVFPAFADYISLKPKGDDPIGGTTYLTTVLPSYYSSEASWSTTDASNDRRRRLRAAHDDAASYIASDGEIRGAFLESALQDLRRNPRWAKMDEGALVQAILAFPAG